MTTYLSGFILLIIFKISYSYIPPNSFQQNLNSNYKNLESSTLNIPKVDSSYAFGYDIEDDKTRNVQFRNEKRHENGSVTGSYGYLQPDGNVHKVVYVADQYGYRATVEIKPRGNLKPIHIYRPETQLFDFSSDLPPPRKLEVEKPIFSEQIEVTKPVYEVEQTQSYHPHINNGFSNVGFSTFKPGSLNSGLSTSGLSNPGFPTFKPGSLNSGLSNSGFPTFKPGSLNSDLANSGFSRVPFPYNIPNYISKNVEKPKYRMERGFVPYFPEKQKDLDLYKKLLKDYYVIPLK